MRFEQLEYFYALVSSKTIQAVSEKFFTSPQVVSKAIKQLEKELNTTLFFRTRKGLRLTEDGMALYPHAKEILSHYRFIRESFIEEKPTIQIQELNVLSAKGTSYCFSDLMKNMDISSPVSRLNIIMNIMTAHEINNLLYTKNNYDIIATAFTDKELETFRHEPFVSKNYIIHTVYREKIKLWVNKNSPYAAKGKISYKQLKKIPLIRYNLVNLDFDNYLKEKHHVNLSYPYQFSEITFAFDLLQKNMGALFAPEHPIFASCPNDLLKNIIGLDLDIDFYQTAVFLIAKKKMESSSFSAIIQALIAYQAI